MKIAGRFLPEATKQQAPMLSLWLNAGRRTHLGKLVAPTSVINSVEPHQIRQTASKLIIESKCLYGESLDSIKKAITQLCRRKRQILALLAQR
jgi:hypothetical protein